MYFCAWGDGAGCQGHARADRRKVVKQSPGLNDYGRVLHAGGAFPSTIFGDVRPVTMLKDTAARLAASAHSLAICTLRSSRVDLQAGALVLWRIRPQALSSISGCDDLKPIHRAGSSGRVRGVARPSFQHRCSQGPKKRAAGGGGAVTLCSPPAANGLGSCLAACRPAL